MGKTVAPLLSMGASGQIGKTMVATSWKGRNVMRRYVVPSNPKTAAQTTTRTLFSWLQNILKYLPTASQDAFSAFADNSRITTANAFTKVNLSGMRGDTDLTNFFASTPANGGLASAGATFTAASAAVDITLTEPTLPTGWSIVAAHSCAVEDGNPQSDFLPDIGSGTDASTPYEPDITGLLASTQYMVAAWFEYTKPNGDTAYGPVERQMVTTLA